MKDLLETIHFDNVAEAVLSAKSWREKGDPYQKSQNEPTVVVTSKLDLVQEIGKAIKANGNECNLNYIDVGIIEDFSDIFYNFPEFNGDISGWDMKNAKNCTRMFCFSKYTGEHGGLKEWNMDNVVVAQQMFYKSKFKGDISVWTMPSLDIKRSQQFMGGSELSKIRKYWPKRFR